MNIERRAVSLCGLIVLLGGSGILHLLKPGPYVKIVPPALPQPEMMVLVSGLAEVLAAGLLAFRPTRRIGAWFAASLFVAVFPANVFMFIDSTPGSTRWWVSLARLPLQPVLILWALGFRSARGRLSSPVIGYEGDRNPDAN